MSEELQTILIVLGIFVIVGTIAYFASPDRGKPAPKNQHEINLPEWGWVALALSMWLPFWIIWGAMAIQLVRAFGSHNLTILNNYWMIFFLLAVLPSFWYLYKRRFRTLAWWWLVILTAGRVRPKGPINRIPFEEPDPQIPPNSPETLA